MKDFDLVILTIERDIPMLSVGLSYIRRFLSPRNVVFIAPRQCAEALRRESLLFEGDRLIDEDEVSSGLTLGFVRDILKARGVDPSRAGWYLKQIAIFAYAMRPDVGERYLVWDADTVPLREMTFFDAEGRTLLDRKTEYHEPYFATLRRLAGIERQVDHSFIAEHMMFDTDIARALAETAMRGEGYTGPAFARCVLDSVADGDLGASGFSEYETYGNFAMARFPERVAIRRLPSSRYGAVFFERPPKAAQLFALSGKYAWASFEAKSYPRAALAIGRTVGRLWARMAAMRHPSSFAEGL
jgi:hypothetical protein